MTQPLRIVYAGTPEFSVAPLNTLISSAHEVVAVYTQPDRPAGRGRALQASAVKQLALAHNIDVYQPVSFNNSEALQVLSNLKPDLIVVTAYGLLLPEAVLNIPKLGCINIHASLLPRWRGAAPIQRAILAGDCKTGITLMQMDKGLDTGDILAHKICPIEKDETGSSLHDKLAQLGAATLSENLNAIVKQKISATAQDNQQATYAKKLNKAEAKIDWSQPALQIECMIRAFNAWPVAYCSYQKKQKSLILRLWHAQAINPQETDNTVKVGTVIAETKQGIDVQTGKGILRITELQAQGKRRLAVADYLNANSLLNQTLT